MIQNQAITDIPGIEVGQAQDEEALTGCTVILCRQGAVAGVDQRGGAPGTRETDLLNPINLVEKVHAILLAGGSAFGLDAATGVMRYLEEQKIGFKAGSARIPIVPRRDPLRPGPGPRRPTPRCRDGLRGGQVCPARSGGGGQRRRRDRRLGGENFRPCGCNEVRPGHGQPGARRGRPGGRSRGGQRLWRRRRPSDRSGDRGARPAKFGPVRLGGEGRSPTPCR